MSTAPLEHRLEVDGIRLAGHLARPSGGSGVACPGLVFCHGFPAGGGGGSKSAHTYPQLADRIAADLGWMVLAFNFRGCRPSEGQFSLEGWLADVLAAIAHLRADQGVEDVWCAGFGTGGALAVCAAATDVDVRGVAAMGAPADFGDWAGDPRRLLRHSRELGLIRDPEFPTAFDEWAAQLEAVRADECARRLAPRPLLLVHGSDDDVVPVLDARAVGDAYGMPDMRILSGARHQLRHDPRLVAILLGWLDRQGHAGG